MKVLYLFSGSRKGLVDKVRRGENHGNGFWGMLQLPHYDIEADYIEIEQYVPSVISRIIRKYVNVYFIHLFIFWKLFSSDIVFTSAAFGTQLFHALLHIRKPIWVMHDFSIIGLLGNGKTIRQKLFKYMVLRAKGVVTLSLDEKTTLLERFPHLKDRVEFIPFGVDLEFFKPQGVLEVRQILAVGFDPDRDWKTMINACKDTTIPVVLATRESRVKKYMPLPAHISIQQFTPRDLVKEYEKSSVVVVPLNTSYGTNDAMGCSTLFEAMAVGKPVIVTRTRATESYVTDGSNALLVEEGNPDALYSSISHLMADGELRTRLGKNAREYALKNLDIEACTKKLADFFKKL